MAKKKNKHLIGKKEFIFNFLSLIIVILIGVYFGARSFYYYSKQNMTIKKEAQTLNGLLINNNKTVTQGDGLYRDSLGYYFKGNVISNYVSYGNRLFRVISIGKNNTVKVVSEDLVASFMWGEDSSYATSNLKYWLDNNGEEHSGVYYDSLPNPSKFITKTSYREDILNKEKITETKNKYSDYVSTISISDYVRANGKSSYLNNGKIYYLLGLNGDKENLYVDEDGSVQGCSSLEGYGVRAVITFKANIKVVAGNGSKENPYVIDQGKDANYVDSYVKLGNDNFKVYQEDKNGLLKLYKYGYAVNNGVEIVRSYSKSSSLFDLNDRNNIAYFLNTAYLNSLSYANVLVDNYFYTGEISSETGYNYKNIYNNFVTCKVGLLNIFDYVSNNAFNDYFHMNTTSTVGSMQYNTYSNGLLEEADVDEGKHIVPVISISKNSIKGGTGKLNDPYVVE